MRLLIGENIKRLRRARGITQEEMAAHLGISFQSISKWERSDGYPDMEMLPALAHQMTALYQTENAPAYLDRAARILDLLFAGEEENDEIRAIRDRLRGRRGQQQQ